MSHSFTVRARVLRQLGDELIRSPGLAVFELVKNAYDADATYCDVSMQNTTDTQRGIIIVEDNGSGMSPEVMQNVWMVIGTDYRARQREKHQRTKLGRFPQGNKGLGRLAVHKLGEHITVITRAPNGPEVVVELDWNQLEKVEDLANTSIAIITRDPINFPGDQHGTRVEVRRLRETWDKTKARALQRLITSLCSPFRGPEDFQVTLKISPANDWLDGLLHPSEVRETAIYYARGEINGSRLTYDYEFRPLPQMHGNLVPRKASPTDLPPITTKTKEKGVETVDLNAIDMNGTKISVGAVKFEFFIFDLETSVLSLSVNDIRGFKTYLKENGGIRVYRDGVRVFNYGEPGDDWLNLDARRVNEPTGKVGNRQILGVVQLDGENSRALVEKSNREGFVENAAFNALKVALHYVLAQVEAERSKDQKNVRTFYSRKGAKRPVADEIADLRESLQEEGLLEEFEPKLKKIEQQFEAFQDTMLQAAAPGLMFGSIVHQVEKLMKDLVLAVRADKTDIGRIRSLVEQLGKLIDGIGDLFRRSKASSEKASALIRQTLFNSELRFQKHKIEVVNGLDHGGDDFTVNCSRRLVVASLMNFVDNSIFWVQAANRKPGRIYIGTSTELEGGPCIVVADNGPGFQDDPESLTQPFFTRRNDGMGLGLYLSNQAAESHIVGNHKGRLVFPQKGDITLPKGFDGAVIAFQFPKTT